MCSPTISIALTALCLASSPRAHDPGLSSSRLVMDQQSISVRIAFSNADLASLTSVDTDGDGTISASEVASGSELIVNSVLAAMHLRVDGVTPSLRNGNAGIGTNRDVVVEMAFDNRGSELTFELQALTLLPRGHRHYVALQSATGEIIRDALLSERSRSFVADLRSTTPDGSQIGSGFSQGMHFLALGFEHILIGYDHVLFLMTLLLVGGSLASAAWIITSFTLAHSLTLALAALDVVRLPGVAVESAIALSVVCVAIQNIVQRRPRHRTRVTFAFGLIHGLGFAAVLRELGFGASGDVIVPLLTFNLGVELGQIAIAAVALPIIWWLARRTSYHERVAPAASAVAALIGAWWVIERTLLN